MIHSQYVIDKKGGMSMLNLIYVYPGTFCPPTLGHENIVDKASKKFHHVIVLCSVNPEKENVLFTQEECKLLWQTYDLPLNVTVETFDNFIKKGKDLSKIVMIRGIRDNNDLEHEKRVKDFNKKEFGINNYKRFKSDKEFRNISSSKVRLLAERMELEKLSDYVSPLVISALLEKILHINNLFLVVGRTGSGKSTFLKILNEENSQNAHIDTDVFNKKLRPLLVEKFGDQDLIQIATERGEELRKVIEKPWMEMLKKALWETPEKSNVFVEIPYGLQSDKLMFRFVGGKVIYIGCKDNSQNVKRIHSRNTPELEALVNTIPDWEKTVEIAEKNKLSLARVDTDGSLDLLKEKAKKFNHLLQEGDIEAGIF